MPDSNLNRPYTPTIFIPDANGDPVTSGVVGTMNLYGPVSPAGSPLDTGAVAHQGFGNWGHAFPATDFATAGVYRWEVTSLTVNGAAWGAQDGAISVGVVLPWMQTKRDIVAAVCQALEDGYLSAATISGTTTTLVDTTLPAGATTDWVGSELLLLSPANTSDRNPVRVTGYDGAGTLTFAPAVSATSATAASAPYLLANQNGRGWPVQRVLRALDQVYAKVGMTWESSNQIDTTTDVFKWEYDLPADFVSVYDVWWKLTPMLNLSPWRRIGPQYWSVRKDQRKLVLDECLGFNVPNYTLRLDGTISAPVPQFLASAVDVRADWMVDACVQWLKRTRGTPDQVHLADELLADLLARPPARNARHPGEVFLDR